MDKKTIEAAGAYAKNYLENLLNFYGINVAVEVRIDDQVIQLDVPSTRLNRFLIGNSAETLAAFQSLVSLVLSSQGYQHHRVNLDIAKYKQQRLSRLANRARAWLAEVKQQRRPKELEPMNPAERRLVHQLAAKADLKSSSVGFGSRRRVVLKPGQTDNLSQDQPASGQSVTGTN